MRAADFSTDPLHFAAAAHPERLAVLDLATGERLTYRALDDLADRAAGWIVRTLGDAAGERIGFLGRNGIELLTLALGAERCGAIFVPFNWRLAAPEIAALVADSTPRLLLAQAEFSALAPDAADAGAAMAAIRAAAPEMSPAMDPDRPAILLYTSGTTGRPKGVVITARNAFAAALNFAAVGEIGAGTVAFSDLPMFHTIGLIAVARTTLMAGGTLLLADRFLPARTLAALAASDPAVTHYFAVPPMLESLAALPDFDPAPLRRLHAVFVGGAPLAPAVIERFLGLGIPLVNGYGMSEAGTAMHVPIDPEAVRRSAGAVGIPAPHLQLRLVRDGADVPAGEVGEVWLRGPSVSPGYWRQPAATAAAFAGGWYRSGDLARREPDGFYRIVDRLKDMYVSGGENVYPAEIEAALLRCPGVADAAVIAIPDRRWGETGLAFVAMQAGTSFDRDSLAAYCATQLAGYKRPARIVELPSIPRGASGKLLKLELRHRLEQGEFP